MHITFYVLTLSHWVSLARKSGKRTEMSHLWTSKGERAPGGKPSLTLWSQQGPVRLQMNHLFIKSALWPGPGAYKAHTKRFLKAWGEVAKALSKIIKDLKKKKKPHKKPPFLQVIVKMSCDLWVVISLSFKEWILWAQPFPGTSCL